MGFPTWRSLIQDLPPVTDQSWMYVDTATRERLTQQIFEEVGLATSDLAELLSRIVHHALDERCSTLRSGRVCGEFPGHMTFAQLCTWIAEHVGSMPEVIEVWRDGNVSARESIAQYLAGCFT